MFCSFTFLNFLYSIICLFTSLPQHKISRSKPIALFLPGRVQPWKQGATELHASRQQKKLNVLFHPPPFSYKFLRGSGNRNHR